MYKHEMFDLDDSQNQIMVGMGMIVEWEEQRIGHILRLFKI